MALKFRKVKRSRRAQQNPLGISWFWFAAAGAAFYLWKTGKAKQAAAAAQAVQAQLTARTAPPPTAADPATTMLAGVGGIFTTNRGLGSI